MKTTSALIEGFAKKVASGAIDICNELSLQHELGIFLTGNPLQSKVPGFPLSPE